MRLQRFLARSGVASRRGSEDLMTAGRVRVNGVVVDRTRSKVDPSRDVVEVDGRRVSLNEQPVYIMLNKPAGLPHHHERPAGEGRAVASLIPAERYPGLFPVGRLDKDTTGLLLFTTDGDLGQALLHPQAPCEQNLHRARGRHHVRPRAQPLRQGITLDDGPCQPARCRLLEADEARAVRTERHPRDTTAVEVIIREGRKNRCEAYAQPRAPPRRTLAIASASARLCSPMFAKGRGDPLPTRK